MGAPTKK